MRYKRDKTGVEISGDADQVKGFVWYSLIKDTIITIIFLLIVWLCCYYEPKMKCRLIIGYWAKKLLLFD